MCKFWIQFFLTTFKSKIIARLLRVLLEADVLLDKELPLKIPMPKAAVV